MPEFSPQRIIVQVERLFSKQQMDLGARSRSEHARDRFYNHEHHTRAPPTSILPSTHLGSLPLHIFAHTRAHDIVELLEVKGPVLIAESTIMCEVIVVLERDVGGACQLQVSQPWSHAPD